MWLSTLSTRTRYFLGASLIEFSTPNVIRTHSFRWFSRNPCVDRPTLTQIVASQNSHAVTARITCRWFCGSSVFSSNYPDPARPWVSSDQSETTKPNSLRKDCYYSIRWFISLALRNYILESISVPGIRFRADWGRRGEELYQPEVGECWKNDRKTLSYQSGVKDEPVLLFHNIPYARCTINWLGTHLSLLDNFLKLNPVDNCVFGAQKEARRTDERTNTHTRIVLLSTQ